jgi:hypothetical protein
MSGVSFCTCLDRACSAHPSNHSEGCTPCVAKNLAEGCIPVCFYRKIDPNMPREQDYSFRGFARFVMDRMEG